MKIYCVMGARPNFVKMARLYWALAGLHGPETVLIHTRQHRDFKMSDAILQELGIPTPHIQFADTFKYNGAERFGYIMAQMEDLLIRGGPGIVVVVGDVDSTLACALAANRVGVPVAHVEAGLRSKDMSMPEEVNRRLVDQISTLLFCTEEDAVTNLSNERLLNWHLVGNTMMDTLIHSLPQVDRHMPLRGAGVRGVGVGNNWGLATLHRPSNVDDRNQLRTLLNTLEKIGNAWDMDIRIPMHPRLQHRLEHLEEFATQKWKRLYFEAPMTYFWFLSSVRAARIVFTDSGGVQEEAAYFKTPCVTMRKNTERPCTLKTTNRLGGVTEQSITAAAAEFREGTVTAQRELPAFWRDGKASERIAYAIDQYLTTGVTR